MSFESSKAIADKFKAIQRAVKEQDKKKAAESVQKPSKSYSRSRNRSKNSGSGGSSKGKSSKTVSGNEKQGGNDKKQGFQAGPMQPAVIQKKKKSETLSRNELIEQIQSKE